MHVTYVTIQFPALSETFATNEVRTLRAIGVSVSVHGLRRARRDAVDLLHERGLDGVDSSHNSVRASLRGALRAMARPKLLVRSLAWVVRANRRKLRDLLTSLVLLPRAFDILASVEREQPDVVHMYWGHFPSLVGYLVQQHLPGVVTSMSIVAYDLNREYGGTIDVARKADVLRTHARANVGHIARFTGVPAERVNVIYNGVDVTWVERTTKGIAKVPRRFVAIGRLIPDKGMDDVLTAFATIKARWPDASLVMAGDGPDRGRLVELCESLRIGHAVDLIGHVSHVRVVEEMAKAEVLVLMSRYAGERLPNVVKEGMACGCVCITTPTQGIEELVQSGVTGFVVAMNEPQQVYDVVEALDSGRANAVEITAAAASHVRLQFDLRRTAPRYESLWRAAVEGRTEHQRQERT